MELPCLKDFTLPQLEDWVERIGERRFRARQLFRHIYVRGVTSWSECSDLSKMFRTQLEYGSRLNAMELRESRRSRDGTVKYLFALHDGHCIETVMIPDAPRTTLCLSSQVGCAMGCRFCVTGSLGLKRNLSTAEIVDQVCQVQKHLPTRQKITNLVFMGMGEPLANYEPVVEAISILTDPSGLDFSHRRITLSTVGLVPQLRRLGRESPINLAISLHAPENGLRSRLMPVNRTHSLENLMAACRDYPLAPRKRITFEYILMGGLNDQPLHARQLVSLLAGIRAKVNLIPLNPHEGCPFQQPKEEAVLRFQELVQKAGYTAIIRQSRGADIGAACGQLAAEYQESSPNEGGTSPGGKVDGG